MFTSRLDDVVLFGYGYLQRLKVVAVIDVDVLVEDIFVLANQVEAFDSHDVQWYEAEYG